MPSKQDLMEIQSFMAGAIMRPLNEDGELQCTPEAAEEFIKANQLLTSAERLSLYNQQYWFRVLDAFWEDFPGLIAILGDKKSEALAVAYLTRYPSVSFTLRDLGSRLERFVTEEPLWICDNEKLALDMIRFEWAEVVAFDAQANPPLKAESLVHLDPMQLKLELQPYITLLEIDYALDTFLIKLNKNLHGSVESNAAVECGKRKRSRRAAPRQEHLYIAVHRFDNVIYYKRLHQGQYRILCALRDRKSLGQACSEAFDQLEQDEALQASGNLRDDFSTWMELGWFCEIE